MSMASHPRDQLSAYLDGALAPREREAVEGHLAGCPDCRARLSELRGVAALLGSLPDLAPSRRLRPRLSTAPAWLAPLRTLATLASGVSVFLFMATAILSNIGWLAQGSAAANAPAIPRAALPAASAAAGSAALRDSASAPSPTPEPKAAVGAATQTAAPSAAAELRGPTEPPVVAAQASTSAYATSGRPIGPAPWVWLVLAIVMGAIALALQRRLRSS